MKTSLSGWFSLYVRKMKRVWTVFLAAVLLVGLMPQAAAEEGILRESVDNTKPKIISVIFDDSTSMIQDDESPYEYTTRWVDADYALKAMASMMDEKDTLRLYIMGDYQTAADTTSVAKHPTTVNVSNKESAIAAIETCMSDLESRDDTCSLAMTAAKNDFTDSERRNKDCWIVVLTDGWFITPERLDATRLKEELVKLTQVPTGSLHVAYVPIGRGAAQLEEDAANHIIVPKETQDVTKQVTEIINRIYGRVRMDDNISRQYLITEADRIIIRPNVPMEKIVVFLQYQGEEETFASFEARMKEGAETESNLLTPPLAPSAPAYLSQKQTSYFGGKQDKPISSKKFNMIKYHVLQGAVFTWEDSSSGAFTDFANQEIVIPIAEGLNIQKEVYYQPAVHVGFDYLQDGEPAVHSETCGFAGMPLDEEEDCIQAGALGVKLKMLDTQGKELQEPLSPFLYPDQFLVNLYPEDHSGRVELQNSGTTYQYVGTVEEKKYTMQILTPWNEVLSQTIDVLEKRKPLEILPVSRALVMDDASGEQRLLTVQLTEGGEPISAENTGYVNMTCTCDDENLLITRQGAQTDGRWSFLITLTNPSQHQIAETAVFHLTAVRNYSKGSPSTREQDVELPLTSNPHTMEARYDEKREIKALNQLFLSQTIEVEYYCDKELLTKDQRENLTIELTDGEGDALELMRVDDDGSLLLRRTWRWWNVSEQQLSATLTVEYTKYNQPCKAALPITFPVEPIKSGYRILAAVLVGAVLLWIGLCIFKGFTSAHIKKKLFYFKKEGRGLPYKLKLDRRQNLFVPFYQKATLTLKAGRAAGSIEPMPGIRMVIKNRASMDGYVLCNWQDFTDVERYRIGNLPITEQNSIFSSSRRFSVKNGFQEFLNLSIEERR